KCEHDEQGESKYHGGDGPLGIELAKWKNPLADAFIDTAETSLNVPRNDDFNRPNIKGTGYWRLATWRGRRSSTSSCYIKPNRDRPNLDVLTEAYVTKIEFDGKKARGVVYEHEGQRNRIRANRETILSAGALQTPQLLQLSGIGPANLLKEHKIGRAHV